MKKFKCTVTRTDEYEIEINEKIIDDEWIKGFESYMYPMNGYEEFAEHIAQHRARFGERFIEGIGIPLEDGEPSFYSISTNNMPNKGFNVKVVSEDNNCEVDVEEVEKDEC